MADILKYDMTNIWASAGDVVAPDAAKINAGWGVEVVPRQWWNWFENRQDQNIAYMLQKGIPEWDATTQYIINKSYVTRSGVVYRATATSTNSDPITLTSWVRAFADYSVASNALGALTPAADQLPYFSGTSTAALTTLTSFARTLLDDVDATTMRTTLAAQQSNTNLTSLSGVTAVANGLPYFTGTTAMGIATITAFGRSLIDDADNVAARLTLGLGNSATRDIGTIAGTVAAGDDSRITGAAQKSANLSDLGNANTARTNLGLTSAATTLLTTSTTDSTVGRILKVGDFGLGSQLILTSDSLNTLLSGGNYITTATPTPLPVGWAAGRYVVQVDGGASYCTQVIGNPSSGATASRGWNGTSWSTWLVGYNTGNTADIVSQVQANIQPTLDAKVNKAGDTMTGRLNINTTPYLSLIQLPGGTGLPKLEFHRSGVSAAMMYMNTDGILYVTPTNGEGVAGSNNWSLRPSTGDTTQAGGATFQGPVSSSGAVTGGSIVSNGTITAVGTATLPAITSTGTSNLATLNVTGVATFTATPLFKSGEARIVATGTGTSVMSFYAADNTTLRGLVSAANDNTITIRAGSANAAVFSATGAANFNATTVSSLAASSGVTATGGVFTGNGSGLTNIPTTAINTQQTLASDGWVALPGGAILQWMKITESTSGTDYKFFPRSFPTACTSVSCCIDAGTNGDAANYGVNVRIVDNTKFISTHAATYGGGGVAFIIAVGY